MKRFRLNLNLTIVIVMIAAGVLLPVLLSTAVGIVAICIAKDTASIVTGVLIISFTATAAGCGLLALVFAGRKARLARQQSDFVANISHEFRTPLSAIKLYAQTLQSGKLANDPEKASECIATILRETEWLDVMIDRVLAWRASSKDLMELNMQSLPTSTAVAEAVDRFRTMVQSDEITLSTNIETALCVLHDPDALNAVILNLLTNAYKYTGDDKKITVSVHDRGSDVIIEVEDNGFGMTSTEAKRIFEPFHRAGKKGSKAGVGLGLAIARHLVNEHRGTISVVSEKDKGSTFTISLPAAESAA